MNEITAVTQSVHSVISVVGYDYDFNGNRTEVTYPGGTNAVYVFGADNRLESVDLSGFGVSGSVEFKYDGANRVTNIVHPNTVNSSFGYNGNGNVTSIKHGSFVDRVIGRNTLGFKTNECINAGLAPTAPTVERRIKTHNDADMLVSEQVQSGTNWTDVTYSYSANGCLTNNSETGQSLSYDYDNRVKSVDGVEYLYDASGARVGRVDGATTNYFVVDYTDGLKRPLAETDASGTITRYYVWSGSQLLCHIEAKGAVYYYHSDELGSTLAITDSNGAKSDEFAYMPYGYARHTGSTETPFQWLGGYGVYYDADSDLHLTLHRAYSSKTKRFLQPDPLGIDGGANVYAWANRNPLWFVDPYGLRGGSVSLGGTIAGGQVFGGNVGRGVIVSYDTSFFRGVEWGTYDYQGGGGHFGRNLGAGLELNLSSISDVESWSGTSFELGGSVEQYGGQLNIPITPGEPETDSLILGGSWNLSMGTSDGHLYYNETTATKKGGGGLVMI